MPSNGKSAFVKTNGTDVTTDMVLRYWRNYLHRFLYYYFVKYQCYITSDIRSICIATFVLEENLLILKSELQSISR